MTMVTATRRVATYERVSSEDQRERETIKTQTEALERRLAIEDSIELVERYGTLAERSDDSRAEFERPSETPGRYGCAAPRARARALDSPRFGA